jgi:glycosyltransferase involved in cell wall biosynthesis
MATWNGTRFLRPQLESLRGQTWSDIDVVVSDDGSTDGTVEVIDSFARNWSKGRFQIIPGPRLGFSENFRWLIRHADVCGEYVAFCDQDDIWKPEKLADAIAWLSDGQADEPRLWCGRTEITPTDGDRLMSPLFSRPPSFRNALVQSIAGANTMVMNRAAFDLVRKASERTGFVSHDWWCYLLVTGAGGTVHYSPEPGILYRQHEGNVVGANMSIQARSERMVRLLQGQFRRWTEANIAALDKCADLLTEESRHVLETFRNARGKGLVRRLRALRRSGVYRQTRLGQVSLFAACILRRV